jgi:hypothetical protein
MPDFEFLVVGGASVDKVFFFADDDNDGCGAVDDDGCDAAPAETFLQL